MILLVAGPEGGEEPSGGNFLRLIQIRFTTPSLEKISLACQDNSPAVPNRRFKFQKRRQLFIRARNETLSVAAMRVMTAGCDTTPTGMSNSQRR
jgi:hypothetical protein